jgi:Ca2+-binding EF-hand superfamily protein
MFPECSLDVHWMFTECSLYISSQVKKLLNLLGLHPSPQEVAKMIKEVDKSGNGQVAFEEFVQVIGRDLF